MLPFWGTKCQINALESKDLQLLILKEHKNQQLAKRFNPKNLLDQLWWKIDPLTDHFSSFFRKGIKAH